MRESYHTRVMKGKRLMYENDSSHLGNRPPRSFNIRFEYESDLLKALHDRKKYLLQIVEAWYDCPESYRNSLYKILFVIDISQKETFDKLDAIKREVGNLEFILQINPTWILNLLGLVDALIEQTKQEKRDQSTPGLGHLKKRVDLLINSSKRYRLTKRLNSQETHS